MNKTRIFVALGLVIVAAVLLFCWPNKPETSYRTAEGQVFGTFYKIQYEANEDWSKALQEGMQAVDNSLSVFNQQSIISRVNRNEEVETDSLFEMMFATAKEVSERSNGAFDITVMPLVNLWGFGFKKGQAEGEVVPAEKRQAQVDSLMELIGFGKVQLENHRVVKEDPRIMLDASALAKGFGCDIVANILREKGCKNFLVDIGGEVVTQGKNAEGRPWRIGITKPIDDVTGETQELQTKIEIEDIAMATSGNYRNYYYEGEEKRSHTVNPRTGYPVEHTLLSATVTASDCMHADAMATACMVLGEEEALRMIEETEDAACYLVVDEGGKMEVITSSRWKY